jgi:hypothetical protein
MKFIDWLGLKQEMADGLFLYQLYELQYGNTSELSEHYVNIVCKNAVEITIRKGTEVPFCVIDCEHFDILRKLDIRKAERVAYEVMLIKELKHEFIAEYEAHPLTFLSKIIKSPP